VSVGSGRGTLVVARSEAVSGGAHRESRWRGTRRGGGRCEVVWAHGASFAWWWCTPQARKIWILN